MLLDTLTSSSNFVLGVSSHIQGISIQKTWIFIIFFVISALTAVHGLISKRTEKHLKEVDRHLSEGAAELKITKRDLQTLNKSKVDELRQLQRELADVKRHSNELDLVALKNQNNMNSYAPKKLEKKFVAPSVETASVVSEESINETDVIADIVEETLEVLFPEQQQ